MPRIQKRVVPIDGSTVSHHAIITLAIRLSCSIVASCSYRACDDTSIVTSEMSVRMSSVMRRGLSSQRCEARRGSVRYPLRACGAMRDLPARWAEVVYTCLRRFEPLQFVLSGLNLTRE